MRVVILSGLAQRYVSIHNRWTVKRSQARVFENGWDALQYAREHRLGEVHLLFDFGDPSAGFFLEPPPVPPAPQP